MKGKVQTNAHKVNILVEHEGCSGRHYSSFDFDVECEKMTNEEINEVFDKTTFSLNDKKDFLKKIKGFAVSNVYSKESGINYGDLFRYKL